jgi:thiamine biosynthesis lipoprotein
MNWQPGTAKLSVVWAIGLMLAVMTVPRSPPGPATVHTLDGSTMGTTWQVQVLEADGGAPSPALAAELAALLQRYDRNIFSSYAPESELSRLNRAAVGEAVVVSRELLEVLLWSRTISKLSFGAFDVTVGELVNLWGFGPAWDGTQPSPERIAQALSRVDSAAYQINAAARTVTRTADVTLDLSAIAKGYAVDAVAERLLEAGYAHFLVEVGGEIRAQGWSSPEQSWQIAIEEPVDADRKAYRLVDSRGEGVGLAGSGDYRNYRTVDGVRFSHEIDPRTGYPVTHSLSAVTVLAATAAEADAWATALMVLGPEDGPYLAEYRGLAAFFIMKGEQGWQQRHTPAFEPYLSAFTSQAQGISHGQTQL